MARGGLGTTRFVGAVVAHTSRTADVEEPVEGGEAVRTTRRVL